MCVPEPQDHKEYQRKKKPSWVKINFNRSSSEKLLSSFWRRNNKKAFYCYRYWCTFNHEERSKPHHNIQGLLAWLDWPCLLTALLQMKELQREVISKASVFAGFHKEQKPTLPFTLLQSVTPSLERHKTGVEEIQIHAAQLHPNPHTTEQNGLSPTYLN